MEEYDVIIIGAGIGGLVCGSYLVKAGLTVLIVEQRNIPGGYCTSFERKGYRFDVGVHYFGGVKNGILGQFLEELGIKDQIHFNRFDPTDKIIMPENIVYIRANSYDTISSFKKNFPKEKCNIERFFKFIMQKDLLEIYIRIKRMTFFELLNEFFEDIKLKSTLSVLLCNIGTSPKSASAFASVNLFRQYILDPGYYLNGGVQAFPDLLSQYFRRNKGNLLLSKKVIKIIQKNRKAIGVVLSDGQKIKCKVVVSNADATYTFKDLLNIKTRESKIIEGLKNTPSVFLVYLGFKKDFTLKTKEQNNIWYFSTYNIEEIFIKIKENILTGNLPGVICSFPSLHDLTGGNIYKHTANILFFAPYETHHFWRVHEKIIHDKILLKFGELFPNFENFVDLSFTATPLTLKRYTLNRDGAFAGWSSSITQMKSSLLPHRTSISNLYITGHWASVGFAPYGGISSVIFSGRKASKLILENFKSVDFNN